MNEPHSGDASMGRQAPLGTMFEVSRTGGSRDPDTRDERFAYDEIDRRLIDTFPASDAVARY